MLERILPPIAVALGAAATTTTACTTALEEHESVGTARARISGGYGDAADQAVVGVALIDADGLVFRSCSGTLIAQNLVLTAQHCVAETASFVDCHTSSFGPPLTGDRVRITTAPLMWSDIAVWHTGAAVHVPPGSPAVCGRDMALVVLREAIAGDEAEPLAPRLARAVDETEVYSAVGFGSAGEGWEDGGQRRRRDDLFVSCVGPGCGSTQQVDGREWRGDQGICSGDSGGPALDREGSVIGVTSRGPTGCDDPIYGGLIGWKGWIRAIATDAARSGNYAPPPWIDASGGDGTDGAPDVSSEAWSSCTAFRLPARRRESREPIALLAAAVALACWRTKRRKVQARGSQAD